MKYKLVIFDMDGTFLDSRKFHAQIFYDFFRRYFKPVTYEKCYRAVGVTVRKLFDECGVPREKQDHYFDLLDHFYNYECDALIPLTKISRDFKKLLELLGMYGIKRAVVTNSLKCVVEKILIYHGLDEMFEEIEGADRDSVDKIERCRKILKKYSIPPKEVFLVGDTEGDMKLARDMDFNACFANTNIAWRKDEAYIAETLKPEISISEYAELIRIFEDQFN